MLGADKLGNLVFKRIYVRPEGRYPIGRESLLHEVEFAFAHVGRGQENVAIDPRTLDNVDGVTVRIQDRQMVDDMLIHQADRFAARVFLSDDDGLAGRKARKVGIQYGTAKHQPADITVGYSPLKAAIMVDQQHNAAAGLIEDSQYVAYLGGARYADRLNVHVLLS